jgi:hypothetical protein
LSLAAGVCAAENAAATASIASANWIIPRANRRPRRRGKLRYLAKVCAAVMDTNMGAGRA